MIDVREERNRIIASANIALLFEGLPLLVTLVWVAAMEVTDENPCWEDYDTNNCIFIIVIPMLSILLVPALSTIYPISYK